MDWNKIQAQHDSVYAEIILQNQYHVYKEDLEGKGVIDIGANNGVFTLLACEHGAKSIFAVESNPGAFKMLQDNTAQYSHIHCVNLAAWSTSHKWVSVGREDFFCGHDGRCWIDPLIPGSIKTISLADIIKLFQENLDLVLKMDCEGAEHELIYTLDTSYFKRFSAILCEIHENIGPAPKGEGTLPKLVEYIKSKGFKVVSEEVNPSVRGVSIFKFMRIEEGSTGVLRHQGFGDRVEELKNTMSEDATIQETVEPLKFIVEPPKVDFPVLPPPVVRDLRYPLLSKPGTNDGAFTDEVTVLINGFLRPENIQKVVDALRKQTLPPAKILVYYTKPTKDFKVPFIEGIDFIVSEEDRGLPGRFAVGLVARTPYLCIMDDDLVPGEKWLESTVNLLKDTNSVICGYGMRYDDEDMNDLRAKRFGDHGEHNDNPESVDVCGHCFLMKKEWLKYFWMEEPLDWKISDDIHLSYTLKKYGNISLLVSPHPEGDKSVWSNTDTTLGLGFRALHARKDEDTQVWKDPKKTNSWEDKDIQYLKDNTNVFADKRQALLGEYVKQGFGKKKPGYVVPIPSIPTNQIIPTMPKLPEVTCVLNTKDRYYSTLSHVLLAICHQTYKPKYLLLYDDSKNKKDLRQDFIYAHILPLLSFYGIVWEVVFTPEEGQVANHIKSLSKAKTEIIWRCDDDAVPEPMALEKLLRHFGPDVGAVGGLIIQSNDIKPLTSVASNKIEDIYVGLNEQWYIHPDNAPVKEVDHLNCSFLYRRSVAEYCTELSIVGHREESLLTYEIKRKGYKILLDPSVKTWHWRNPEGGIRSSHDMNNFTHDERVFQRKMQSWCITPNDYNYVVLENGIGDHYAFKSLLPQYLKKYATYKKLMFTAFPSVFTGVSDIKQGSIADANIAFGNLDKYNIYKWMIDHNWKDSMTKAFAKMYNMDYTPVEKKPQTQTDGTIIISPYSFDPKHAKSYPYWDALIPKIKEFGYKLIQIGRKDEVPLTGMDDYWWDYPLSFLSEYTKTCSGWIGVDNFFQHLVNCVDTEVKGVVIWGVSDPLIFGYDYNTNILKGRKYLRPDQFGTWRNKREDGSMIVDSYIPRNNDAFERPDEIIKVLGRVFGTNETKKS